MRIFLDVMGGDNAPSAIIEGAIIALNNINNISLVLAGDEQAIQSELSKYSYDINRITIEHCSENITNNEAPVMAVRKKKDSAIVKGMLALREKTVDAFISAGSTGAVLAGSMFRLGRIEGIERPAIAPLIPNGHSYFLLADAGANVDCKPEYLMQFAQMGDAYMRSIMNIANPRIGLVNIGAEEEKGDELRKASYKMLENSRLNFIGNVEARYITSDTADVIVCDGFVGNVILKYTEGIANTLISLLKKELLADTRSKIGALLAKPAFARFKKSMDYTEVGGAPLLGVNGVVVKAHGSSNANAIHSAIKQAIKMIQADLPNKIKNNL